MSRRANGRLRREVEQAQQRASERKLERVRDERGARDRRARRHRESSPNRRLR